MSSYHKMRPHDVVCQCPDCLSMETVEFIGRRPVSSGKWRMRPPNQLIHCQRDCLKLGH